MFIKQYRDLRIRRPPDRAMMYKNLHLIWRTPSVLGLTPGANEIAAFLSQPESSDE